MADVQSGTEFPEIRAQGPLFRITDVFLWDDEVIITSGISSNNRYLSLEPAASSSFQNSCTTTDKESSTEHTIIEYLCVEELELAQQMDALGLPLSFGTSKAMNNVTARSKQNGTKPKSASHANERNNPDLQMMVFDEMENPSSSSSLQDNINTPSCLYTMEGQLDTPHYDAKEQSWSDLHIAESKSISAFGSSSEIGKKPVLDEVSDTNSGTLVKFKLSPYAVSFDLSTKVLDSSSLHGDEDAYSRTQFHHDKDLLNKQNLDRCSDHPSTSCCNMRLNYDTETLQSSVSGESPLLSLGDSRDNFFCCELWNWRVFWDPFYESNYFFNVQTLESTWLPPLGLEKYAFAWSNLSRIETHEGVAEKNAESKQSCDSISIVTDSPSENGDGFHFTDEQTEAEQPVEISAKLETEIDFTLHYTSIGEEISNAQLSPCSSVATDDIKEYLCVEELELAQQMDALGLPLSFGTSKAMNNVTARSKQNGTKPKSASHANERNNPALQMMVFDEMENPSSSSSLQDNINTPSCLYTMEGQHDTPHYDAKEQSWSDLHIAESKSISAFGSSSEIGKKPVPDEVSDTNSGTLVKFKLSPYAVSFDLSTKVLDSSSLLGDEDAYSRTQFHHDKDLLNKQNLDRCSDHPSTSCCNMRLNCDTETLQSSVSGESPLLSLGDSRDNIFCCELWNWRVFWDPFYESNYFFNVQTLESTWLPPLGLEKYAFAWSNLSRNETHEGVAEKNAGSKQSCDSISIVTDLPSENGGGFHFTDEQTEAEQPVEISAKLEAEIDFTSHYTSIGNEISNAQLSPCSSVATDDIKDEENECKDLDEQKQQQQGDMIGLHYGDNRTMPSTKSENGNAFSSPGTCMSCSRSVDTAHENVAINNKMRARNCQSMKVQLGQCISYNLLKYWRQRYSLFSRFDNGIKMDEESWFSVTPEQIAKQHALRCGAGTIIDCFSGVGGNAIQFALRCNRVIAIDIDPQKIDFARHNATIYGVSKLIDFRKEDFFKIAPILKGDVAFLAPPWGGPDYAKQQTYDIKSLKPREGQHLFKIASMIAPKVVMFLPRNVNLDQLKELSLSADPPWNLEIEKNFLNGKLKSITAYFDRES